MGTVPDRSAATLLPIITRRVKAGTTIITDEWLAYSNLAANGFVHLTVKHKYNFVDPVSGAQTLTIERAWRGPKHETEKYTELAELLSIGIYVNICGAQG